MTTVLDTLQKGTAYLERHGVDEARLNMQHLLAHALKCERMQLYLDFDRPLDEATLEVLRGLVKRRGEGEPLQHLMGEVEFLGEMFLTDARALVPRPETEELVDRLSKRTWSKPVRLLDVGTGSGVIGLRLAKGLFAQERLEEAVLIDAESAALELAAANKEHLGLTEAGDKVRLLQSDLFEAVEGDFDLIVANLPYVAAEEMTELSREVQRDPESALVGGEQGTELMERFLVDSRGRLRDGGLIAMEYGLGQAEALKACAEAQGYGAVEVVKDMSGHERFLLVGEPAS